MKKKREPKAPPHHTPEPWFADESMGGHTAIYREGRGSPIVKFGEGQDEFWKEPKGAKINAARIVACINACAGIPTEALEGAKVADLRDTLRATLDGFWHYVEQAHEEGSDAMEIVKDHLALCQVILAKFEGQGYGKDA